MRTQLATTKNVAALHLAFENLAVRDAGVPGMGLVHGYTGAGKTTAITWLINRTGGLYVRAAATWTAAAMLGKLMTEVGAQPLARGSAAMVEFLIGELSRARRPLFVDEADYLVRDLRMLETLRDIHDLAGVPVVLIGMAGLDKRLHHRQQLLRRVSQWVEFLPSDIEDARTLADTVCEVGIDDDLLALLHAEAQGSVGQMVVGLARIEALAKGNGWRKVSAEKWGDRKLFLTGRRGN